MLSSDITGINKAIARLGLFALVRSYVQKKQHLAPVSCVGRGRGAIYQGMTALEVGHTPCKLNSVDYAAHCLLDAARTIRLDAFPI